MNKFNKDYFNMNLYYDWDGILAFDENMRDYREKIIDEKEEVVLKIKNLPLWRRILNKY